MQVPEQSIFWLEETFFTISLFFAIWFFYQGYVNIKTGKVSRFGFDAFMHFVDTCYLAKQKNPNWDNPKRLQLTGIIALVLAVVLAKTSFDLFNGFILPHLK